MVDGGTLSVWLLAWLAFGWVLRIVALFVVPRNRGPSSGMAWLMLIFLVPIIGWIGFLILGFNKLPRHRRDAQKTLDRYIVAAIKQIESKWKDAVTLVAAEPPRKYVNSLQLGQGLTHLPLFTGNAIDPLSDYDDTIRRITMDVIAAKSYVLVEYYILALDSTTEPFIAALEAAARRGVKVRVLYDAFGSHKFPRRKEMLRRLRGAGVEVYPMLPLHLPGKKYTRPDLRNHRKLVVVDGTIGYTGSLNMIERAYHRKDDIIYDELVVRIEGPVDVQLEAVFLTDWYAETGVIISEGDVRHDVGNQLKPRGGLSAHVVPSGPGYEFENNRQFFASLFYAAERSITIVNPYFVPDDSLITALTSAVKRGVTVTLLNSEAIDQVFVAHAQRSYYEQILNAGVEIRLYKKPSLLHSKYAIIDDDACFVGSSNMDIRSFELNQELTITSYDKQFVASMQKITDRYMKKSRQITKASWAKRPPRKQLLDNIARLTSSLQ